MSTKNETPVAEATKETQKLSVLDRIKKLLKLDDAGRVEKFFTRETKKMLNNIDTLEMNKQAKENHIHVTFEFVDFEKVCFGNSNRLNLSLELWQYFSKTFQNHFSHCSGRVP